MMKWNALLFLKSRSITFKIFCSIIVVVIISIIIIVLAFYSSYSKVLRQNEIQYNVLATNHIKSKFDMTTNLIQNSANSLTSNQSVLEILKKTNPKNEQAPQEQEQNLIRLFQNVKEMQPYTESITLLGINGIRLSSNENQNWNRIYEIYEPYLYQLKQNPSGFWTTQGITISYVCPIFQADSKIVSGLLIINLDYQYLREMFMISAIKINERVLVADSTGNILFNYPHFTSFEPFLKQHPELLKEDTIQKETNVYGVDSIIVLEKISLADWRIIRIIQTSQVTSQTNQVLHTLELAGIVLLIICMMYSFWITRIMTKPIKALECVCKQVQQGNLDVRVKLRSHDEYGTLGNTFNLMLDQLQDHFKKEMKEHKRKSEMQFQILQAQINPHFLYNTLDSIRWLAVMQNIENIAKMSSSLISLLKYNLSSSQTFATLQEELESVKNYIEIQKFRYSDIFDFSIKVDPDAMDCHVLRFILQPLVENSIIHGFLDSEGVYSIRISAFFSDEQLHIKVIDNGSGMEQEKINEINSSKKQKNRFNHIGVANIRERIQLYFGKDYGLKYDSVPNVGTIVELVLPVIHSNENGDE